MRQRYPWLKLLFVPAACTDLVQPADRGMISWLKANMRQTFNDVISADILKQMNEGVQPADVKLDVSAPHLKSLLASAFAKALSELPAETVLHCWALLMIWKRCMQRQHRSCSVSSPIWRHQCQMQLRRSQLQTQMMTLTSRCHQRASTHARANTSVRNRPSTHAQPTWLPLTASQIGGQHAMQLRLQMWLWMRWMPAVSLSEQFESVSSRLSLQPYL